MSRCLPLPRHRGDRLILFHLLRGLRARGHHCSVVALSEPSDDDSIRAASAALADVLEVVPERPRSGLAYLLRIGAPFPSRASRAWHPEAWKAIVRLTRDHDHDIVHFLGGIQVYEHRDAVPGRVRLIHPYESYSWWLTRAIEAAPTRLAKVTHWLRKSAARSYERRIYRGFDRVVVSTDRDERCLRSLLPGLPTAVLPLGVDLPSEVVPVERRPESSVIFVGTLSYGPNVRAALRLVKDVLPRLREQVADAAVALVGADPPEAVRRLEGPRVRVTGTVPDVLPWLSRARVFVSALQDGAGMKSKVLEAMAAGTPVVATPMSCDGLDVRDGDHVLLADSPQDLANGAARVLRDDDLASRLARSARRLVEERYGWPTVVSRTEELYAEMLAEHGRGSAISTAASR